MDPGVTFLEQLKEMQEDRIRTRERLAELESEIGELRTADRYRALVTLAMWGKEKITPLLAPDGRRPSSVDRGLSPSAEDKTS